MLRTSRVLRRACSQPHARRFLHEDSRGDFLGFSGPRFPGADPRYGMDMTRAPGYEVAADDEPPLVGNQKLADFAARHARLSAGQAGEANGYMWMGSVLYPTNLSLDCDVEFPWEREETAEPREEGKVREGEKEAEEEAEKEILQLQRRYTGGQARRIRRERERSALKKATRRLRRRPGPTRKPHNDVPDDE